MRQAKSTTEARTRAARAVYLRELTRGREPAQAIRPAYQAWTGGGAAREPASNERPSNEGPSDDGAREGSRPGEIMTSRSGELAAGTTADRAKI